MRSIALAALLTALAPVAAIAQLTPADTFYVTLVKKSPQHFSYGREWDSCLALDGVEAAQPILVRGQTYVFQHVNVSRNGGMYFVALDNRQWFKGMSASTSWGNMAMIFTPPANTPDILRYEATWEFESGGWLHFVDSLTTDASHEEYDGAVGARALVLPNPFAESAVIRYWIPGAVDARLDVFDELGRTIYSETGRTAAGDGTFRIDARQVGTGYFLYRISVAGGSSVSGTLTVLR